ncbi:MAG: prepilin-type N-terminal cleavage/methylation domain-containing protein [Planctomycetota bacterium]|nr:prepilin-type N-terminal cleavage/methylation domain-containing protein [Planctomycetota bacterium]
MRKHSTRAVGRGGFTLVELLVVIGIIALLISILLPALHAAKLRAQSVACSSDVRQIYIAMALFAQDNKGHLPRPYGVGELSSVPQLVKVAAWLQKVAGASGHIDLDDEKGALWKQLRGREGRAKVLMCPGDDGEALAGHPVNINYPRNISYSLNYLIERDVANQPPRLGLVLARVRNPSARILIYEELAPNDSWCIMGLSSDDVPSGRHAQGMRNSYRLDPSKPEYYSKGRGNHCFFDGHVESLTPSELIPPKGKRSYHSPLIAGDPLTW